MPSVTYPRLTSQENWSTSSSHQGNISRWPYSRHFSLCNISASIYFLVFLHTDTYEKWVKNWENQVYVHRKAPPWVNEGKSVLYLRNNRWWGFFWQDCPDGMILAWSSRGEQFLAEGLFVKSWTVNDKASQMLSMHQDSQS